MIKVSVVSGSMSFEEQVRAFADRIPQIKTKLSTEESTKNSLIMPLLNILGYNVFDPTEVNPEYTADFGVKTKEKVDYAILKDGQPIMLIECKPCTMTLGNKQASQLYRYFSVCDAKIGILTNGLEYYFYTDLDEANKMDKKPFLTINLEALTEDNITQLAKFQKESFDTKLIITQGQRMREVGDLVKLLQDEIDSPSEDFVRFITKKFYDGVVNQKIVEKYRPMIKAAFSQIIANRLNTKVQALQQSIDTDIQTVESSDTKNDGIVTTEEEILGFAIVRAIGMKVVPVERIQMRDAKSYCAILFDNNNRKPIVRMHFNSPTTKYVSTFNKEGKETKQKVDNVYGLYGLQDQILEAITGYLETPVSKNQKKKEESSN